MPFHHTPEGFPKSHHNLLPSVLFAGLCIGALGACSLLPAPAKLDAQALAQDALIVDTHIDVPYRLENKMEDVSQATQAGQFDHPRAVQGGLNAAFMSIYIPAQVDQAGQGVDLANRLIDGMERLAADAPNKFAIATCSADISAQANRGLISLPLGMENGGPVATSPQALDAFFERGIRYITLAHSRANAISDSSYDIDQMHGGLSPYGKGLIRRMNDLGVMVDVSHITDAAFNDVMTLSQVPVIASHSSLRHFTPSFNRNMSDDMVVRLGAQGGVIQINFGSAFLTQAAQDYGATRRAAIASFATKAGITVDDPQAQAFAAAYRDTNPYPFASLDDVLDHIDRAVALAGIDGVGIGSDYDGVGDSLPTDLKDVSTFPNLIAGLQRRGYSEADIRKILGENLMRVWRDAEAFAASQGQPPRCRG